MRIVTLRLVVFFIKWTPLSLEVEYIEISVFRHQMNKSCLQVTHTMSKRAVFPIVTFINILPEVCAEFSLVFFDVVKSFYSVVCIRTIVLLGTGIGFCFVAQISFTFSYFPPFVLNSVIESAVFVVMLVG